ncbi:MAG: EAL domain-containing protein [Sporomusaceae bacterium]|nr:EAL domain-containing protein [Sporomusaceae bacterium]
MQIRNHKPAVLAASAILAVIFLFFAPGAAVVTAGFGTVAAVIAVLAWKARSACQCDRNEDSRLLLAQRYEHLLRQANDAILLVDDETRQIFDVNQQAETIYGYCRSELIGLAIERLRSDEERSKFAGLAEQLATVPGMVYETVHRRKSGALFPVEISASAIHIGDRRYWQALIRDNTQRKTAEEKSRRLQRLYAMLLQLNEVMARIKEPRPLCDQVCRIAVETGLFTLVWVGTAGRKPDQAAIFSSWGATAFLDGIEPAAAPAGTALCGRHDICNDFFREERMRQQRAAATACGIRSSASFPLRCRDFTGVLTFYCDLPEYFGPEETGLLNSLSANLCFALESAAVEKQRQKAENSLHRFQLFSEQTQDIILFANPDGRIIEANPAASLAYGYSRQELLALRIGDLVHKDSQSYEPVQFDDSSLFETVQARKDGTFFFAEVSWQPLVIDEKAVSSFIIRDITRRKTAEQQLQYISTHDTLTGLSNRRRLGDFLEQAVKAARNGISGSLLVLNIDNFKLINDTLGHATGDELLQQFAAAVKHSITGNDQFARLSGDEFAIIRSSLTADSAKEFAESLRRLIEQTEFKLGDTAFASVSISIGIVHIDGELDGQDLLSHADFALHSAKAKGRNRVILARREGKSLAQLSEAGRLLTLLKQALREDKLVLYFQPVVQTLDRSIVHYEALLRLPDGEGGLISPALFIPVAETFGLMPKLDLWVVKQVVEKLQAYPDLQIFTNISGVSLSDEDLCRTVKELIVGSGIDPSRIGFEITETAAVTDSAASAWLDKLRQLGCSFALDDFGIGFSSFSYVRRFPVDYIKIDGSYVRDLAENKQNQAIVGAIVQVAHALGQKVIAEYVESEAVLRLLRHMGVACVQGYLTGKPSPLLPADAASVSERHRIFP